MKEYKLKTDIIEEIVRRIVSIAEPEKIILFGSYAYGTPDADSDIDLLVIKPGIKSKTEEYSKTRKSLKGIRFPFDIIVISPKEYEFYSLKWKNSILAEAREKGTTVYGS
jgi:predicted nucleotidyltransferase